MLIHSQGMPECGGGKQVFWRESSENVLFLDNWKTLEEITLHKYVI